jgi:hypothetical protein
MHVVLFDMTKFEVLNYFISSFYKLLLLIFFKTSDIVTADNTCLRGILSNEEHCSVFIIRTCKEVKAKGILLTGHGDQ